jgi:hypothetical protein
MTGMAASPYVKALDDIQKALTGFLKPVGFKKKGRTYNRQVGDGLVQVVNLYAAIPLRARPRGTSKSAEM